MDIETIEILIEDLLEARLNLADEIAWRGPEDPRSIRKAKEIRRIDRRVRQYRNMLMGA